MGLAADRACEEGRLSGEGNTVPSHRPSPAPSTRNRAAHPAAACIIRTVVASSSSPSDNASSFAFNTRA